MTTIETVKFVLACVLYFLTYITGYMIGRREKKWEKKNNNIDDLGD